MTGAISLVRSHQFTGKPPIKPKFPIASLHVPRAGGTTLNNAHHQIARYAGYRQVIIDGPIRFRRDAEYAAALNPVGTGWLRDAYVIYGHFSYGLHSLLQTPVGYITVLRDPIDRMLSDWHHSRPPNESHSIRTWQELYKVTPAPIRCRTSHFVDNLQVRMISGVLSAGEPCPPEALTIAKRNLRRNFFLFGVLDEFEAFLSAYLTLLDLPSLVIAPLRVGEILPDSHEDRAQFRDFHKWDIELLDWARARSQKRIRAARRWARRRGAAREKTHVLMGDDSYDVPLNDLDRLPEENVLQRMKQGIYPSHALREKPPVVRFGRSLETGLPALARQI